MFLFVRVFIREEVMLFLIRLELPSCLTKTYFDLSVLALISLFISQQEFLNVRLIVVGFSGGTIQNIPANHLLIKNISAMGIYLGGYLKNRPEVIQTVLILL